MIEILIGIGILFGATAMLTAGLRDWTLIKQLFTRRGTGAIK